MNNVTDQLNQMKKQISSLMEHLDIEGKTQQLNHLEKQAGNADFWDDPETAQKIMQRISKMRNMIDPWQAIYQRISDAVELNSMDDPGLLPELTEETKVLTIEVEKMTLQAMLSGPHDQEDAILAIHAGAGGTDSQDWAEMLERMYIRWAEQNGYKIDIIDRSDGEEAGIKSVTLSVRGDYAYGYLRSEQGVHRLVRLSPFDKNKKRHTSFSKAELWPDIQDDIDIEIKDSDLRVDTYRASGAGGQHVQKNDTAVRMTHIPTGIVVQCQNQRSQAQNRERALQLLKARLFEMEQQKQEEELAELKGENVDAGWGNQIRSYVLHPYQVVKDHRTNFEVGNPASVLDGQLGGLMEAYLKMNMS